MNIHHIGYAVHNIDHAIKSFLSLGYSIGNKTIDTNRKVIIVFVKNGNVKVELIAPLELGSPVEGVLEKNGPTPYHICYKVLNIDDAIKDLMKEGWIVLIKPAVAPAITENEREAKVAFLYNKNVGLIELLEIK